ncbi:MAG: DUF1786 domain-containing protein [Candidatus Bathyarchaeota archaeon]|nr:MAG: DUF1786 domain-containing protein [Candidatus Bathyarchaeota archaeon]
MKILAIDIGAGTKDVLLFDDTKETIENCVKLVLPSPSQVYADRVRRATAHSEDIFVNGDVVGGGAFTSALKHHLKGGHRVTMTEQAAYSVRNTLDQVRALGIEITTNQEPPREFAGQTITIKEISLTELNGFLAEYGESLEDVNIVAVAVQDHGVSPSNVSDRRYRIKNMQRTLESNPRPEALAFLESEIPTNHLRMQSVARAIRSQLPHVEVLLMDTSPDAILGCLFEEASKKASNVLAINVGNGHTMAALISEGKITGIMEHHTRYLNHRKLRRLLIDFMNGSLTDEEVYSDKGHGAFYLKEPPSFINIDTIVATGPNRNILEKTGLSVHFAAPAGDVMMSGPIGLVEAAKARCVSRKN